MVRPHVRGTRRRVICKCNNECVRVCCRVSVQLPVGGPCALTMPNPVTLSHTRGASDSPSQATVIQRPQ
jgi:hypothetical protein